MKLLLKKFLNRCLHPFGLTLLSFGQLEALERSHVLLEKFCIELLKSKDTNKSNVIGGIVFSKDRALQLHALLGSYFDQVKDPAQLYILYAASTKDHQNSYEEVHALFKGKDITFTPQKNNYSFREDLIDIVNDIHVNYLFFLVDDIIIIEHVSLKELTAFNPSHYVPTLRMGLNLKYCYPMQSDQSIPSNIENVVGQDELFSWYWADGELDWNYPLSVDGHFFRFKEINAMLNILDYKAPNSLESALQQFKFLFINRTGLAYRKSRIVNIPINKVQLENNNICGSIHQDDLLQLWNEGLQLDYKSLYGVNNISAHQELSIKFIKRVGRT